MKEYFDVPRYVLYVSYACFFLIMIIVCFSFQSTIEQFKNKTKFSDVDTFGPVEKQILGQLNASGLKIVEEIPRRMYSSNESLRTQRDLDEIKDKMSKNTTSRIDDIKEQVYLQGNLVAFSEERNKETISAALDKIKPIILKLKEMYNRPRPYHLDKSINPVISPPRHPSYPSGHATESYIVAYWLSEKNPDKKQFYMDTAKEISVNREYAGVHFREDTEFGMYLAKYLYDEHYSGKHNPLL